MFLQKNYRLNLFLVAILAALIALFLLLSWSMPLYAQGSPSITIPLASSSMLAIVSVHDDIMMRGKTIEKFRKKMS